MTTEELQQIKSAAERIHAASINAGKWDPKPEWEECLMRIVCDISRAVTAEKGHRRASMKVFEERRNSNYDDFDYAYMCGIDGTVEDYLADAVIDILDTVEGFDLKFIQDIDLESRSFDCFTFDAKTQPFIRLCVGVVDKVMRDIDWYGKADCDSFEDGSQLVMTALCIVGWCLTHGIDLRRHVELKMKYNEVRL